MEIVCLDLEGVLIPEIWVNFAEATGIEALKATTRDIPDYDELMTMRLAELDKHKLALPDIEAVIEKMSPMSGAKAFVDWLDSEFQLVILSDTFYQFAKPLMAQLGYPTLFCHNLIIGDSQKIESYKIRIPDPKRKAVISFKSLNFKVFAAGDSYNDTTMLSEADAGFLFRPPQNVIDEFPQFPVANDYAELAEFFRSRSSRTINPFEPA